MAKKETEKEIIGLGKIILAKGHPTNGVEVTVKLNQGLSVEDFSILIENCIFELIYDESEHEHGAPVLSEAIVKFKAKKSKKEE